MMNPYAYSKRKDGISCVLKEETPLWSHYRVDFTSSFESKFLGGSQVVGEYLFPKGEKNAPLAILVHGMGKRSMTPCKFIAHTLARKGIASFTLYLVLHFDRAPESIKKKYPSLSAEEWFESYQMSVIDVQQVIDWASGRTEIEQDKIFVVGISFGGFISSIAMALDNRIKSGVFIVCGGNSEKLTRHSALLRWQYKVGKKEYRRNQETYMRYLADVAEKGFDRVEAEKNSYLTDPLTFSKYIRNRPVLMLNALWDEMIPRAATLDLWEAYGRPPIAWYPATHASIWIWYPFIGPRIAGFLKRSLLKNNETAGNE
jgi:cephalosporin-C deacetylase-like acetyl esterase